MNFGKNIRKFRRNMRAISPVIATLLMIAIAVVASLVTYAWVMGYMNFTTEKTGKAIQIQSVSYDTTAECNLLFMCRTLVTHMFSLAITNSVFINGAACDLRYLDYTHESSQTMVIQQHQVQSMQL